MRGDRLLLMRFADRLRGETWLVGAPVLDGRRAAVDLGSSPCRASASRSRLIVMSETPSIWLRSLTRAPPACLTCSRIFACRMAASMMDILSQDEPVLSQPAPDAAAALVPSRFPVPPSRAACPMKATRVNTNEQVARSLSGVTDGSAGRPRVRFPGCRPIGCQAVHVEDTGVDGGDTPARMRRRLPRRTSG